MTIYESNALFVFDKECIWFINKGDHPVQHAYQQLPKNLQIKRQNKIKLSFGTLQIIYMFTTNIRDSKMIILIWVLRLSQEFLNHIEQNVKQTQVKTEFAGQKSYTTFRKQNCAFSNEYTPAEA